MWKRILLASLAVFIVWSVLDFLIHGVILKSAYVSTAALWRPMAEMKLGVMYLTVFLSALIFSIIYGWLVGEKSLGVGLKFGLLYGLGIGVGMGYGTYSVMPIPYHMALTWFLGAGVEGILGGLLLGMIVRK